MESDLNGLSDLSDLTDLNDLADPIDLAIHHAVMLITAFVNTTLEPIDRQHPYQLLNEVNK